MIVIVIQSVWNDLRDGVYCVDVLVRFEVAVHDAVVVQVFQSQDGLSEVHACHVQREGANVLQ